MVSEKKYEEAADMLVLLQTIEFKELALSKFNKLLWDVMPLAVNTVINSGYALLSSKQYTEALKELEKVQVYSKNDGKMDQVYYYMGRCYKGLNDSQNAILMFQKVIDDYPRSRFYSASKKRLAELTQLP